MTELWDTETILAAIETGLTTARTSWETAASEPPVIDTGMTEAQRKARYQGPTPTDDYVAWCVLQELRRAGWAIVRKSN